MDQNIESGKSDALNKTWPTDQSVSIKLSKQLEKRLEVELEVIVSICYTISGSFPKDYRPTHLQ
jgi:hypothetical protein